MFLPSCTKNNIGSLYQKQTVHLINAQKCEYNSSWDTAWSAQSPLRKDSTTCDAKDVFYGSKQKLQKTNHYSFQFCNIIIYYSIMQ
jgi:hypothetical protein